MIEIVFHILVSKNTAFGIVIFYIFLFEIKRWIDDEKAIALIYWENMEYSWLGGSRPAMSLHGYLPSNS